MTQKIKQAWKAHKKRKAEKAQARLIDFYERNLN